MKRKCGDTVGKLWKKEKDETDTNTMAPILPPVFVLPMRGGSDVSYLSLFLLIFRNVLKKFAILKVIIIKLKEKVQKIYNFSFFCENEIY